MSTQARLTQITQLLTAFFALKPNEFFNSAPTYSDFDGPNVQEAKQLFEFVRSVYENLIASNELQLLPWNAFNALQGLVQNVNNSYNQLLTSRDQGSWQNFAVHLDSFAHHTRMFGIPYLAAGGAALDLTRNTFTREIDILIANNKVVDALKKDVRTLITPAVAGSLSQSFATRRDTIARGRMIWLFVCVSLGAFIIYATYDFAHAIGDVMVQLKTGASADLQSLWPVITIRSIVLVPLFGAFGFAFSQYRKEREFEEEYAHKAAVATSLPNYGDLAREQSVRDQIVTGATNVIFSSPTAHAKDTEKSDAVLGGVREIVESLGKALGRK